MGQQDIAANIQKGNINVVVRVRPLNNSERFANESNVLQFPGNGGIVATSQDKGNVIKSFTFILDNFDSLHPSFFLCTQLVIR